MSNFYTILEIDQQAGPREIKAAYRRLAQKYHPDKNQGDERAAKKFVEVLEAYQVLSDPAARQQYDDKLQYGDYIELARALSRQRPYRPPPPQYYRYRPPVQYTRKAYILGGAFILGLVLVTLFVPFFMLRTTSERHYDLAMQNYHNQQYYAALDHIDLSIRDFGTKNAEAFLLAGEILVSQFDNYPYALKYLKKGLDSRPEPATASALHYYAGLSYFNLKKDDEALNHFEQVHADNRFYDSAQYHQGLITCFQHESPAEASDIFSRLLSRNPDYDEARYFRAYCRQQTGKHEQAIDDYEILLQRQFEPAATHYHKAKSELKLDRHTEACSDLQVAADYKLEEAQQLLELYCVRHNADTVAGGE
jgi:curved DNA-binding protein CbpA